MHKRFVHRHGLSPSQLLTESIHSLRLLGRRSLLALLGIVIGSASIIALINIGRSAVNESIRAFNDLGTDTLVVSFPNSPQNKRPVPSTLDTDTLKQAVPAIVHIAPITIHSARVSLNGQIAEATLVGTSTDLAPALGLKIPEGRFLSDFDHRETFVVVGARVAHTVWSKAYSWQS